MNRRYLWQLVAAALLFGVSSFVAKRATHYVDGAEVAVVRFAVGLAFVFCYALAGRASLRPRRWGLLILRGVLGGLANAAYFLSLNELPVGTTTLLNCTSPAFAALFAALALRERLPLPRALALAVAGGGVVLVLQGQGKALGGAYSWQAVALVSGALAGAAIAAVRAARRTDTALTVFAFFCAGGLACTAPWALARWVWPGPTAWMLMLTVALAALIAQMLLTQALGFVEAATAVTLSQLTVITTLALGLLVDHDPFTVTSACGAALTLAGVVWVARPGTTNELLVSKSMKT